LPSLAPAPVEIEAGFVEKADQHIEIFCGGSLLTSQTVITAAHCMLDEGGGKKNYSSFQVWVGLHDTKNLTKVYKKNVVEYVFHPSYDPDEKIPTNQLHDLALITIEEVDTSIHSPICLPPHNTETYAG
jgi:secreted trypsin-like serine protease